MLSWRSQGVGREGFLQLPVEGGNQKSGSFIDNNHIVYKSEEEQNNLAI